MLNNSKVKSLNLSLLYQKNTAFNFFKVVPHLHSHKLNFQFVNISKIQVGEKSLNVSCISYNFLPFNFSKRLLITNSNAAAKFYFLDSNLINSKLVLNFFNRLKQQLNFQLKSASSGWVYNLNFVGLGYKVFLYKNFIYLKLGYCRLLKVQIPQNIKVFSRKKTRILLLSHNRDSLSRFVLGLKKLRKFDLYKGKGVFEYTSFDGIRLKVGKQQQFY